MNSDALRTAPNGLSELWSLTRLAERDVKARRLAAIDPCDWLSSLQTVVRVGCGRSSHQYWSKAAEAVVPGRTVPSAGALYPFDVIVVEGERSQPGRVWAFDVTSGELQAGPPARSPMAELEKAGVFIPPAERFALVVVLARPWLAMQRYQMRGYFYAHLDAGHAAANIAMCAHVLSLDPVIAMHLARASIIRQLGLEGLCREPLAVITLTAPRSAGSFRSAPGPEATIPLDRATEEEADAFEFLRGMGCISETAPTGLTVQELSHLSGPEGASLGPEIPLPAAEVGVHSAPTYLSVVWQRRSAKAFRDVPVSLKQLGELLGATRRAHRYFRDPSLQVPLRMQVVLRSAEGLRGAYGYSPFNHALRLVAEQGDVDFAIACMHQECARKASALLIVHAKARELVASDHHTALTELHVRAANVGQLLYLAAANSGVGVTCVGAYDAAVCRRIGGLDEDDVVLYVMAAGLPDDSGGKIDRENTTGLEAYTAFPKRQV